MPGVSGEAQGGQSSWISVRKKRTGGKGRGRSQMHGTQEAMERTLGFMLKKMKSKF